MSNRASLHRTQFTGANGETAWGWRICDDYFRSYADDCEEANVPADPLQLLTKACVQATEQERSFFEALLAEAKGILINGSWHDFEEIEPVLQAALEVA